MKRGVASYFVMPPHYYTTKAVFRKVEDGTPGAIILEIDSDDYWNYIHSGPEASAVFKRLPP
jgi:hypothetical protein